MSTSKQKKKNTGLAANHIYGKSTNPLNETLWGVLYSHIIEPFILKALGYPVYVDHVLEVPVATISKIFGELMN